MIFRFVQKIGVIGALPVEEFGRIGASVGEVGLSKKHSERLEPYIFGKMGALDSERLKHPLSIGSIKPPKLSSVAVALRTS